MKTLLTLLALATATSCWRFENGEIVKSKVNFLHMEDFHGSFTKSFFATLQRNGIDKIFVLNGTIDSIEDGALCASPLVEIEMFRVSQLPNLTKEMFGPCPSLKTLKLQGPENVHLDKNLLSTLPNLETLFLLQYPSIEEITVENFRGLGKLQDLSIQFTNLRKVNTKVFDHMENLQKVYIMNNQVETIEGVFTNKNLGYLDFSNNKLKMFPWDALVNLKNLVWFNVNRNSITEYDTDKIANYTPKLQNFIYGTFEACADGKAVEDKLKDKLKDTYFFYSSRNQSVCS